MSTPYGVPVTVVPYGVSGKPALKPSRRAIYRPETRVSQDAMDQPGLVLTDEIYDPPTVPCTEDLLERLEELHIAGDITLDELIDALNTGYLPD